MSLTSAEIITALIALVGFIVTLLKLIHSSHVENKKRLEAMELKNDSQIAIVVELSGKVGKLEGERAGFMAGADKISTDVLDALRNSRNV